MVGDARSLLVATDTEGWNAFLGTLAAARPERPFRPSRFEKLVTAFRFVRRSGYFEG